MGAFGRALLIIVLFYFCIYFGESYMCIPLQFLKSSCPQPSSNSSNCTSVLVSLNTTSTTVEEGADVIVTCLHIFPKGINNSFSWHLDPSLTTDIQNETLTIKSILKTVEVNCTVSNICGNFSAILKITVNASNAMVIILICVGAAAGLILMFAIAMKISLQRGQVQSQARMRKRQRNLENIHSNVTTISGY
ncbi:uncharacterized protein LOC127659752 [Xyrauchen texanus]|uniref:uncharacterized protein LOC127659752 n=1 Tax=Xyrauchen texanus TaxID=154827 RepID=UPI002241DFC1|nr:uncharacterized protein LOC127659752 [Xyrauchen texanus]